MAQMSDWAPGGSGRHFLRLRRVKTQLLEEGNCLGGPKTTLRVRDSQTQQSPIQSGTYYGTRTQSEISKGQSGGRQAQLPSALTQGSHTEDILNFSGFEL